MTKYLIAHIISNSYFFCEEAVNIDSIYLEENWILTFRLDLELSNTGNEVDVILE